MKKKLILYSMCCALLLGCAKTSKITTRNKANELNTKFSRPDGQRALAVRPPKEEWAKENEDFIAIVNEYRTRNQELLKKRKASSLGFTVSGAVVGLGGGIYGVADKGNDKVASITSLITGALTTLLGSLSIQKNIESSSECSGLLEGIHLSFKSETYPADDTAYDAYLSRRDEAVSSIKTSKCFGQ